MKKKKKCGGTRTLENRTLEPSNPRTLENRKLMHIYLS